MHFALLSLSIVTLQRSCYTMSEKSSYSGECSNSNQLPSFFKNSCTGTDSVDEKDDLHVTADFHNKDDALSEGPSDTIRRKGGPGGYTCCVPECFSNSKRDSNLSFYSFPDGKSESENAFLWDKVYESQKKPSFVFEDIRDNCLNFILACQTI